MWRPCKLPTAKLVPQRLDTKKSKATRLTQRKRDHMTEATRSRRKKRDINKHTKRLDLRVVSPRDLRNSFAHAARRATARCRSAIAAGVSAHADKERLEWVAMRCSAAECALRFSSVWACPRAVAEKTSAAIRLDHIIMACFQGYKFSVCNQVLYFLLAILLFNIPGFLCVPAQCD